MVCLLSLLVFRSVDFVSLRSFADDMIWLVVRDGGLDWDRISGERWGMEGGEMMCGWIFLEKKGGRVLAEREGKEVCCDGE